MKNISAVIGLVLVFHVVPLAWAASYSADSNATTVDTRGTSITVSGRVLHSETRAGVAGVLVSLAGQNTATFGDGNFTFTGVSLASGNMVTASKTGFLTAYRTVAAPAGASMVTLSDMLLVPQPAGSMPVVTGIRATFDGIFLAGVPTRNTYTATVGWNGSTPGQVQFFANNALVFTATGPGPEYGCDIEMSTEFSPSLTRGANTVKVIATAQGGSASAPATKAVAVIPLPNATLQFLPQFQVFTSGQEVHAALDFDFPDPAVKAVLDLPVIGKFGLEIAANASLDYTVTDGDWEAALGICAEGRQGKRGRRPAIPGLTRYPKMKLYVGNKEISGRLSGGARGTATVTSGLTFDEVFGEGAIAAKLELGRVGLPDLLGPGLSTGLGKIPGLGEALKTVSVIIYLTPGIEGEVVYDLTPEFAFKSAELTGKVALEAAYEPDLGIASMRLYVGGEPSATFQLPPPLLKELRFRAYAGAVFQAWILTLGPFEYVFVDVTYPGGGLRMVPLFSNAGGQVYALAGASAGALRPLDRPYLKSGKERFVAHPASTLKGGVSPLEVFRSIGRPAGNPAAKWTKGAQPGGGSPQFGQADLPLLENVFPASQPALAGRRQELMLLYVADNGASNALQFTDIRWTRFDGTNWSVPATIHTNTQAEFAPQVAYDGNGDAIAVWERVADANFNETNLTAMAAQMEIVWSRWNHTSGAWSTPLPLTSNGYLDHAPLLCGPMTNGTVLATWTANSSNLLMGTNGAGSQVLWAQWNPASQSWSLPQILLADLPYRLSQSLSGVSNLAVYVWTRDLDGALTNTADQQVFYCAWTNGVWNVPTQFTTNTNGNRNARVSVAPDGHRYLVWQNGTNLVLSQDFSTNFTLVRADSQTAGFADYAMTIGPAGNLVVLWQEMSQAGSDAHYSVLDPVSGTWSKHARLFEDAPLERSFAPVWDDVGNLTVAYNKVEILKTNKTVQLEGGGSVTITNVPEPGRVDLFVTKRRLIKDVTVAAGDFTVDADNYLPGAAVTLAATVRNVGDVAVSNLVVGFYDGNPTNGGTFITNVTVSDWLEGAATNLVSGLWVVPEPATNHVLYVVVDPANAITEFNETNNTQSVSIGGTDLVVSLLSYAAETNGALRVIAQVQNLGAPSATNSMLAIRRAGNAGAPLATTEVPLLEPGRLAQVALDLPPGTQPEGEQLYALRADETSITSDVDTNNNASSFAVNLWLDADSDGMADGFEGQYTFLNPNDPADAALDYDGDGLSNLAEYRAGTNPEDPLSYLRIESLTAGGTNGVQIAWGSSSNRLYAIQRAGALVLGGSSFINLAEHLLSTPPQNMFLDMTATNSSQFFYRVKVE